MGRIEFENMTASTDEVFYWLTILVSNTLGTALGDFVATDASLVFERGALVFTGLIALVAAAHYFTNISDGVPFWAAYVLTWPLGDALREPHAEGGVELGRISSSLIIAALMIIAILLPQNGQVILRSAKHQ